MIINTRIHIVNIIVFNDDHIIIAVIGVAKQLFERRTRPIDQKIYHERLPENSYASRLSQQCHCLALTFYLRSGICR